MKKTLSLVLSVILIALLLCGCGINRKDYSSAAKSCRRFLSKNAEEMTSIAEDLLNGDTNVGESSGHYKDHYYSLEEDADGEKYVKFDIDAQGMLGGQYWSLIYCPDGTLYGQSETYYSEETDGNNISRAEKIDGSWWYYWIDYDGTELSQK